jgi:hypothetical protein
MKYQFEAPSEVISKTAARVVNGKGQSPGLAKRVRYLFGNQSALTATILQHDFEVRFSMSQMIIVKRNPMVFEHFAELVIASTAMKIDDDFEPHFVLITYSNTLHSLDSTNFDHNSVI